MSKPPFKIDYVASAAKLAASAEASVARLPPGAGPLLPFAPQDQPHHGPSFGHNILKDAPCQLPHGVVHLGGLSQVPLEGGLPAMPVGNPRGVIQNAGTVPASELRVPRTHPGAELPDQVLGVGRGDLGDCVNAEFGQPARHLGAYVTPALGGPTARAVEPPPRHPSAAPGRRAGTPGPPGPGPGAP